MPKTLILFSSRTGGTASYADAVADGARSVRFSEVEVRRVDLASRNEAGESSGQGRYQTFGNADELQSYDAIIVGAPSLDACSALTTLLENAGLLTNKVGAAFTSPSNEGDAPVWTILKAMAGLDMILVPPAGDVSLAAQLGKRVADVTSWITHARSHHHSH